MYTHAPTHTGRQQILACARRWRTRLHSGTESWRQCWRTQQLVSVSRWWSICWSWSAVCGWRHGRQTSWWHCLGWVSNALNSYLRKLGLLLIDCLCSLFVQFICVVYLQFTCLPINLLWLDLNSVYDNITLKLTCPRERHSRHWITVFCNQVNNGMHIIH